MECTRCNNTIGKVGSFLCEKCSGKVITVTGCRNCPIRASSCQGDSCGVTEEFSEAYKEGREKFANCPLKKGAVTVRLER
jgi:hypothetical protein